MKSNKKKNNKNTQDGGYKDVKEYIASLFEYGIPSSMIDKLHNISGEPLHNVRVYGPHINVSVIKKNKEVTGLNRRVGKLTIKNKKLSNFNFEDDYFIRGVPNFLYEKSDGTFHPVKFIFEKNDIKDVEAKSLDSSTRCEFKDNSITGMISGLNVENEVHQRFWNSHKEKCNNVGFSGCVFADEVIEDKTIIELSNTTARKRLAFKNCIIQKTNFAFRDCPFVQFLGKNSINEVEDIYRVNVGHGGKLADDFGPGELYFSKDTEIVGHTAVDRQYFFKQIKRFQEKRGDTLQTLIAHKKYIQEELEKDDIDEQDRLLISVPKLFGDGIDYAKPLFILIISFLLLLIITCGTVDVSFLFPMFPHAMFEKVEGLEIFLISNEYAYVGVIKQIIFAFYYIVLVLSWYFILKSLRKFTYKK